MTVAVAVRVEVGVFVLVAVCVNVGVNEAVGVADTLIQAIVLLNSQPDRLSKTVSMTVTIRNVLDLIIVLNVELPQYLWFHLPPGFIPGSVFISAADLEKFVLAEICTDQLDADGKLICVQTGGQ